MKIYYKLTVTATIPHDVEVSFVNAFCLMIVSRGYKWVTFYGASDDIETACDLLNAEGITAKKTFLK